MIKRITPIILSAMLLVTGCTNNNTGSNDKSNSAKLTYSNLVDEETQNEIKNRLIENKIDKQQVEFFMNNVKNYNKIMEKIKTSKNGFIAINKQQVPYDEEGLNSKWLDNKHDYMDINSRISSFILFKDYIESEGKFDGNAVDLAMDLDTIKKNPIVKLNKEDNVKFSRGDIDKFINLYAAIPVDKSTDIKKHAESIKSEWKKRNISFTENSTVSMINVFFNYAETSNVFAGHSGILVKDKDGLLFIEKYGPTLPYQVSKFKDREELKKYLMDRLDTNEANDGSSKPIIMENNELMK